MAILFLASWKIFLLGIGATSLQNHFRPARRITDSHSSTISARQPVQVDLRPWSAGDLTLLERLIGDPAMTEHLGGPEPPEKIRERHARYLQVSAGGMFAIIVSEPGGLPAGSIGYWERAWQGQTIWETGWSVLPEFQRQGVATRAAGALVERVRADGLHRFLHAFPAVDNPPSNAICRRLGFTLLEQVDFEYPPGHFMRCKDWRLDLTLFEM